MTETERKYDIVSIGGATQDVFVQSEDSKVIEMREKGKNSSFLAFPYGSKVDVQHVLFMTGGGATNVAVALAKQNFKIACVASVGIDDAAKSIESRLQRDGVDTSLMLKDSEHGTAYSVILTSFEGDRTVLVYRGAGENINFDHMPIDKMFQTEWIYVSNLGKSSDTVYPPLFDEAKKRNVKIAFNPGVASIKKGLEFNRNILSKVDVLLLNREECLCLLGKPEDTRYDYVREELLYKEMLVTLNKAGVKIPVVTDSFRGVHAYADGFYYFCPAFKVKAVSTLGAGDAFGATFIAGLMRTKGDVGQALIEASANAANVIQGFGAKKRLLSKEGIDKYIAESEEKISFLRRPIAEVGTNLIGAQS